MAPQQMLMSVLLATSSMMRVIRVEKKTARALDRMMNVPVIPQTNLADVTHSKVTTVSKNGHRVTCSICGNHTDSQSVRCFVVGVDCRRVIMCVACLPNIITGTT
jgi:hypothetical protein